MYIRKMLTRGFPQRLHRTPFFFFTGFDVLFFLSVAVHVNKIFPYSKLTGNAILPKPVVWGPLAGASTGMVDAGFS